MPARHRCDIAAAASVISIPGSLYPTAMPPSRMQPASRARIPTPSAPVHGLARVLSKLGVCSRSQAEQWVRAGRVRVGGKLVRDPYLPTSAQAQDIEVDGEAVAALPPVYVMFNKPRGLIVSAADEHGRDTVYGGLADAGLPWIGPVGRLDKASEGLLLLSNDSVWAARITDPSGHLDKTYHVQVDCIPAADLLERLRAGVVDAGERLRAKRAALLRSGGKNAWLEVVLDEGRNRHIRRLLTAHGVGVLRLVRVGIGTLQLGTLPKRQWRHLDAQEVRALGRPSR